jgi:hypothetical protein
VFLTQNARRMCFYVGDPTSTGFEVREQGEAASEITFSYGIMTKRTNTGTGRLEPIEWPSEAGVRVTKPAEPPAVPSPAFPEDDRIKRRWLYLLRLLSRSDPPAIPTMETG